jgi:hypothetical protein
MAKQTFSPMKPARRGGELLEAIGPQLEAVPSAIPTVSTATVAAPVALPLSHDFALDVPPLAPKPEPFVLRLSPNVFRQIDKKSRENGVTMTVIIARALMEAGFEVPENDLIDRRKRRYKG